MTTDSPYFWIMIGFGLLYVGVYTYALVIGPWLHRKSGNADEAAVSAPLQGQEKTWLDKQTGGW